MHICKKIKNQAQCSSECHTFSHVFTLSRFLFMVFLGHMLISEKHIIDGGGGKKIENGLPPTPAAKNYTCSKRNMKVGGERHKSALFISFSLFRRSICRDNSFGKTRPVIAPIKKDVKLHFVTGGAKGGSVLHATDDSAVPKP